MLNNTLLLGDWYEKLISMIQDRDKQADFALRVWKFGATGELELTDDEFSNAWLQTICEYIAKSQEKYQSKVAYGQTTGRKTSYDKEDLKKLIAAGETADNIAKTLNVNKSTIYHDDIWKQRREQNMYR